MIIKKSQVNVIESILLLAMSIFLVFYIQNMIKDVQKEYENDIYYYGQYLISSNILNKYESFYIIKKSIDADYIKYKIYLPYKIFGTTYKISNRRFNVNGKNVNYLIFYLPKSPIFFRISYNFNKDFYYHSGENEEEIY